MKTLGLDIGTNSIGWAVLDENQQEVLGSGVRIFAAGVNVDAKSKAESPKNATRREKRQARRQLFRRRFRNQLLTRALQQAGMLPADKEALARFWLTQPGQALAHDPYQLRRRALTEPLTLLELGRVVFHLNQRRGFRSNGLALATADNDEDEEKGTLYVGSGEKVGITQTLAEWEQGGFRTFGDYLAGLDPHTQRRRNRYTLRSWYEAEMQAIWAAQAPHHPAVLTEALRLQLADPAAGLVFYQRPLRSQKHRLGKCPFEPDKPRCPKSHPEFEEFRMWGVLNNLEVVLPGRETARLDDAEKTAVREMFYGRHKKPGKAPAKTLDLTPAQILKHLKLPKEAKLNYDAGEKFVGNLTSVKLADLFGAEEWANLSHEDKSLRRTAGADAEKEISQEDVWHVISAAQDADWLAKHAAEKWGFDEAQLKKLRGLRLAEGYANVSRKAIRKMLPHLRAGLHYADAAKAAGYHHSLIQQYPEGLAELPPPKLKANPIVQQALYEIRALVNTLLHEYGRFDIIRVELARDLKVSKKKREQIRQDQLKNRRENDRIRAELERLGQRVNHRNLEKYLLWEDCGKLCPYSGREIAQADLFGGLFDIEHILPYDRTLDDSRGNKTLSLRTANADKGNRTPYEWLAGDPLRYAQVLDRVRTHMPRKLRRFEQADIKTEGEDGFVQRQLNDTRYISREARAYLKSVCDAVQVAIGQTTAPLRHYWGLNGLLTPPGSTDHKNRDDHRHHAVDALVVAATTPQMLQEMSRWNATNRAHDLHNFPLPWESFQSQARTAVQGILISQKNTDRTLSSWNRYLRQPDGRTRSGPDGQPLRQRSVSVRGQLHEETVYGRHVDARDGKEYFHVRKPLASLTGNMVNQIVDEKVKDVVLARLSERGARFDGKKFEIPKDAFTEKLLMPNRQPGGQPNEIRSVRIRQQASGRRQLKAGDVNQWVEPGNNHHVAIYADAAGKKYFETVTFWEVVERRRQGLPVVRPAEAGHQLLTTFRKNEMFLLDVDPATIDWNDPALGRKLSPHLYRVQKFSGNIWYFRLHRAATLDHDAEMRLVSSFGAWERATPIKVRISLTGHLVPVLQP